MIENNKFFIVVIIIAILGNIISTTGVIRGFILNTNSKWIWLLATLGWQLFCGCLTDLLKLNAEVVKGGLNKKE